MIKRIVEDVIISIVGLILSITELVFVIYFYCIGEWKGGLAMSILCGIALYGTISSIIRVIKTAKAMDVIVNNGCKGKRK